MPLDLIDDLLEQVKGDLASMAMLALGEKGVGLEAEHAPEVADGRRLDLEAGRIRVQLLGLGIHVVAEPVIEIAGQFIVR